MKHWSNKQLRTAKGQFVSKKKLKMIDIGKKGIRPKVLIEKNIRGKNTYCLPDSEIEFKGRRIVDIEAIAKNLFCSRCSERIFLENISDEKRHGFLSTFKIKCLKCYAETDVKSSKEHEVPKELLPAEKSDEKVIQSVIDEMAVLGKSFGTSKI